MLSQFAAWSLQVSSANGWCWVGASSPGLAPRIFTDHRPQWEVLGFHWLPGVSLNPTLAILAQADLPLSSFSLPPCPSFRRNGR